MKKKLTAMLLGLATSGLVSFAQDNNVPATPPGVPPPEVAPEAAPANLVDVGTPAVPATPEAAPAETPAAAPAETPGSAPAAAGTNAPGAKAEEVVPLIVIDDVPLTDAVRNLARQSNLNFQFDPRITASNQPNVSIRFENVTATEALMAVLENYNLQLVRDSKSRVARVTIKDPKAEEPLISKIVQLRYSDATNMVTIIKPALSTRSSIIADTRTSQLILTTTEKEMESTLDLITKLDTATRQVLIEARLLETSRNPSTVKGIDWAGTVEAQQASFGNNVPAGSSILSSGPKLLADTAAGFNPATAFLNADGVSAVLSFFNKDAETEVVATPRAVTLDNQTAHLSITRAFPVFAITPGSANSPAGATVTYTNLGTILYVTPRIAADNNIALHVVPEVSNIDSVDRQTLNGQPNTANIYAIRRMETTVMIPSGHTLVMGGLITDNKTKNNTKVPVLGDIPLVGKYLFGTEKKSRNKSNLIIFITPTVVDEGDFHANSAGREFLQSRLVERPEPKETAWDSAKPHDWTKR